MFRCDGVRVQDQVWSAARGPDSVAGMGDALPAASVARPMVVECGESAPGGALDQPQGIGADGCGGLGSTGSVAADGSGQRSGADGGHCDRGGPQVAEMAGTAVADVRFEQLGRLVGAQQQFAIPHDLRWPRVRNLIRPSPEQPAAHGSAGERTDAHQTFATAQRHSQGARQEARR